MDAYFETAYAAASGRLCLFVGTGFSKAITQDAAPSWPGLLESVCDELADGQTLKSMLFPKGSVSRLPLDECAQIIEVEMSKVGKSIHEETARRVRDIKLAGDNTPIHEFLRDNYVDVVTTNYDKLVESLAGHERCHSITPGFPVPRSRRAVNVYHVHGSTDSPGNMVVTSEDYFQFMNRESYFSKRLLTLLHENTIVVLGYSLGDTSLKAIISDYRQVTRSQASIGNIFFVSRDSVAQCIKDYYACCYGIRVVDQTEIREFFRLVLIQLPTARQRHEAMQQEINKVLTENAFYTDEYLSLEASFYEILAAIAAIGRSVDEPQVLNILKRVLIKKTELTHVSGAWGQYDHLARWLLYIGSRLDMRGTALEDSYLQSTLRSMEGMSSQSLYGYSWSAYKTWSAGWSQLTPDNRVLIRTYVKEWSKWSDALSVVGAG